MSFSVLPAYSDQLLDWRSAVGGGKPAAGRRTVKVLHVINGEHYSGAERVQDLLAARLPDFGFEVGFACVKPDQFSRRRHYQAAALTETPMRSKFDLRVARRIAQLVRDEKYALIHAHTPRSVMMGRFAASWSGVPLAYHVHSPTSHDSTHAVRNWCNDWLERWSLTGAAALMTVSDSLRQHMLARGYPAERITTVPNGVPRSVVQRSPQPPQGSWTLGMVALFRPRKGLEVLLDALAQLHREGLPITLRNVGGFETPEYEREIRARVEQLGISSLIQWTGFTSDVNAELATMDLFVLPSLFGEGLPMVVLEAMATGVPVVATRVEGLPEAIEDGVHGLLCRPGDPQELARCIREMVQGHRNWGTLRDAALRRHAEEFSDWRMAERVAAVYQSILG